MSLERRAYIRSYQSARRERIRDAWFAENGPCANCGSNERLQVDHIDPTTKDPTLRQNNKARIWSWSTTRREAELAKCQVLCEPCHRAKTTREQTGVIRKPSHGTLTGYYKHGCRCDECREFANRYQRQWRAKQKRESTT